MKRLLFTLAFFKATALSAVVFDLTDFPSMGDLVVDSDTTIVTDDLRISFGGQEFLGVQSDNFAVFTFDQVSIGSNASFNIEGDLGFALLANNSINLLGDFTSSTDVFIGVGEQLSIDGTVTVNSMLTIQSLLLTSSGNHVDLMTGTNGGAFITISNPTNGNVIDLGEIAIPTMGTVTVINPTGQPIFVSIPEPSTVGLLFFGLIALFGSRIWTKLFIQT